MYGVERKMIYAQIKKGRKLHLVHEYEDGDVGQPICGIHAPQFRMSINVPLGNACKRCVRVFNSRQG